MPKEKAKDIQARTTDSCIRLHDKVYHMECQSTPDVMNMHIAFANGEIVEYQVPIIKAKEYTLEYILEKKLYFLIPYYIMRYEKRIKDNDETVLLPLEEEYQQLFQMITKDCETGVITEYDRTNLLELARNIAEYISNNSVVKEKVGKIMGGRVLTTLADRMIESGLQQGAIKLLIKLTCNNLKKGKDIEDFIEVIGEEETDFELIREICEVAEQLDYDVDEIYNSIIQPEEEW